MHDGIAAVRRSWRQAFDFGGFQCASQRCAADQLGKPAPTRGPSGLHGINGILRHSKRDANPKFKDLRAPRPTARPQIPPCAHIFLVGVYS